MKMYILIRDDIPHVVLTESSLDGMEVAIAFFPMTMYPDSFKYYSLYK